MSSKRPNRKTWLVSQLRRLSLRWPPRAKVMKAARRELPRKLKKDGTPYKRPNFEYQCNVCKGWFRSSEVEVDHIKPVVDIKEGSFTEEEFYAMFITGLFSYEDNLQVICKSCHQEKTQKERDLRNKVKK